MSSTGVADDGYTIQSASGLTHAVDGGIASHLLLLSSYHVWAYDQLLTALTHFSDEEIFSRKPNLFFGSIYGTVTHLFAAEVVWYNRMSTAWHKVKQEKAIQNTQTDKQAAATATATTTTTTTTTATATAAAAVDVSTSSTLPSAMTNDEFDKFAASLSRLWNEDNNANEWEKLIPQRQILWQEVNNMAQRWKSLIAEILSVSPSTLSGSFEYVNTRGDALVGYWSVLLLHVFNHATHHRGQITAAMTYLNKTFPALDLLYYLKPKA